jgi:hypothetical protein
MDRPRSHPKGTPIRNVTIEVSLQSTALPNQQLSWEGKSHAEGHALCGLLQLLAPRPKINRESHRHQRQHRAPHNQVSNRGLAKGYQPAPKCIFFLRPLPTQLPQNPVRPLSKSSSPSAPMSRLESHLSSPSACILASSTHHLYSSIDLAPGTTLSLLTIAPGHHQ